MALPRLEQFGLSHPVTGLTVTGRTVVRVRGEGEVANHALCDRAVGRKIQDVPILMYGGLNIVVYLLLSSCWVSSYI